MALTATLAAPSLTAQDDPWALTAAPVCDIDDDKDEDEAYFEGDDYDDDEEDDEAYFDEFDDDLEEPLDNDDDSSDDDDEEL